MSRSMWSEAMNTTTLEEQVFEASEECLVNIQVTSGDLEVHGWDKAQIAIDSPDGPAAVHREGAKFQITPSMIGGAGDMTVHVPRHGSLNTTVCNGDATIEGIDGQINLEAMNGDVEATGLRGTLAVRAFSGDVSVRRSALSNLKGELFSGDCTIESSLASEGEYHLHSFSGDVALLLPEEQRCTLSIRSNDDVECSLPHEVKEDRHHTSVLELNGGGVPFRVIADSGDVTIGAARELPERPEVGPVASRSVEPFDLGVRERPTAPEPFGLDESPAPEDRSPALMEILKAVEQGALTVDEALARISALESHNR